MADPLLEVTARLEAAVERLGRAASRPRAAPEDIAELGRRLDATLARLKLALVPDLDGGVGDGEAEFDASIPGVSSEPPFEASDEPDAPEPRPGREREG